MAGTRSAWVEPRPASSGTPTARVWQLGGIIGHVGPGPPDQAPSASTALLHCLTVGTALLYCLTVGTLAEELQEAFEQGADDDADRAEIVMARRWHVASPEPPERESGNPRRLLTW